MVRTMCSKEIEQKNYLEKILRHCVDDVKQEITKKRAENKSVYYSRGRKGAMDLADERNLTQHEREKIIEVLLSQERVLTLLYDKTFPPRPQTGKMTHMGFVGDTSMRKFNYAAGPGQGKPAGEGDDQNIAELEREIEDAILNERHKMHGANIVNIEQEDEAIFEDDESSDEGGAL